MNDHEVERQSKVGEQEAALGFSRGAFGGYRGLDDRECSRRISLLGPTSCICHVMCNNSIYSLFVYGNFGHFDHFR